MSVFAGFALWVIGQHSARAEQRRLRKLAERRSRSAHPAGRVGVARKAS